MAKILLKKDIRRNFRIIYHSILFFLITFITSQHIQAQCPGPALTISLANTAANCPSNGTITVTAGGGVPTYQYSITSGPVTKPLQISNVFSGLPSGTYTVRVTDFCNSTIQANTTVANSYTQMTLSRALVNPTCNTPGNGSITATVSGGKIPLSYRLLIGATVIAGPQSSNIFNNLPSGNYTLEVTDACGEIRTIAANLTYTNFTFDPSIKTTDNIFIGDGGGWWTSPMPYYTATPLLVSGSGPVMISCDSIAMRFSKYMLSGSGADSRPRRVWVKELSTGNIVYDQTWTPALSIPLNSPTCNLKIGVNYRIYYSDLCDDLDSTDRNWNTQTTWSLSGALYKKCGDACLVFQWASDYNTKNKYSAPHDTITIIASSIPGDPAVGKQAIFDEVTATINNPLFTICGVTSGATYTIRINSFCTTYTNTLKVGTSPLVVFQSIQRQSCKKNLATIYADFANVPIDPGYLYFQINSGPASFTDVNGNVFSITYPIKDSIVAAPGARIIIRNLPVGNYNIDYWSQCKNDTIHKTLAITAADIYQLNNSVTTDQQCNGNSSINVNTISQQMNSGIIYLYKKNASGTYNQVSTSPTYTVAPGFPATYTFSSLLDGDYRIVIYPIGITIASYVVNDCDTMYVQDVSLQYKLPVLTPNSGGFVCTPGSSDGRVELHTQDGISPFTFQRLSIPGNTVITTQADSVFTGLPAGTFRFRVTDQCGNAVVQDLSIDTLATPSIFTSGNTCVGDKLILKSNKTYPTASITWTSPTGVVYTMDSILLNPIGPLDTGVWTLKQTVPGCSNVKTLTSVVLCPPVFTCENKAFLFQNQPTDVVAVDISTGTFSIEANDITLPRTGRINAIGFNVKDAYIWGVYSNDTIVRVGSDFVVSYYYMPGIVNSNVGDIDSSGVLLIHDATNDVIQRVDLNPLSPTYLQQLSNITLSNTSFVLRDWVYNPIDKNLYAIERVNDGGGAFHYVLHKINPATGVCTELINPMTGGGIETDDGGSSGVFGGAYLASNGDAYFSHNTSGNIYRIGAIQTATATTKATLISNTTPSLSNDGAFCAAASFPPEICGNGIDDDGDGLVDCADITDCKPNAGIDKSSCQSDSVQMAATGFGTWSIGAGSAGTATIINTTDTATYVKDFSAEGIYYMIWGNGICSDTALITVYPSPIINAINISCIGTSGTADVTVSASVSSGSLEYSLDGGSYQSANVFNSVPNGMHIVNVRLVGSICITKQTIDVNCPVCDLLNGKIYVK